MRVVKKVFQDSEESLRWLAKANEDGYCYPAALKLYKQLDDKESVKRLEKKIRWQSIKLINDRRRKITHVLAHSPFGWVYTSCGSRKYAKDTNLKLSRTAEFNYCKTCWKIESPYAGR
jgi:hypothetical protein